MTVNDEQAVTMLNGHDTVRDYLLVSLAFEHPSHDAPPDVMMVFKGSEEIDARTVKLVFREVSGFGFLYESLSSRVVEMFKCIQTVEGDFYVSLDPYDEREQFASERDGDFVRAKHIEVTLLPAMKSPR